VNDEIFHRSPDLRCDRERFWAETYASEYIRRNSSFDTALGVDAWQKMLARTSGRLESILECGCNIGRNIELLNITHPDASKAVIELGKDAYDRALSTQRIDSSFNGSILDSDFLPGSFDLAFTVGVLIHIHPDNLLQNMKKIYEYSRRYVLMAEYFNRTPTMIEYRGEKDMLFKSDFGKLFLESFDVSLVDYGFLWGHIYDVAGFDDITWWLFEKKS